MSELPPEVIEAFHARRRDEDEAAGLPPHVTDPDVLALIARLTRPAGRPSTRPTND